MEKEKNEKTQKEEKTKQEEVISYIIILCTWLRGSAHNHIHIKKTHIKICLSAGTRSSSPESTARWLSFAWRATCPLFVEGLCFIPLSPCSPPSTSTSPYSASCCCPPPSIYSSYYIIPGPSSIISSIPRSPTPSPSTTSSISPSRPHSPALEPKSLHTHSSSARTQVLRSCSRVISFKIGVERWRKSSAADDCCWVVVAGWEC